MAFLSGIDPSAIDVRNLLACLHIHTDQAAEPLAAAPIIEQTERCNALYILKTGCVQKCPQHGAREPDFMKIVGIVLGAEEVEH